MLEDGRYEALIVDAQADGDDGLLGIEVTITSGTHKGEVVFLRGRVAGRDEIDLLAAPVTLVVSEGQPQLLLDA